MVALPRATSNEPRGLLPTAHTALLVSAVMVPVTGATVRFVQYLTAAHFAQPLRLAVSAPLNELASDGLLTVLFILLVLGYAVYLVPRLSRAGRAVGSRVGRRIWLLDAVLVGSLGLAVALALVLAPNGPVFLIVTGTGGAATAAFGRHRERGRASSDPFAVGALVLIYLAAGAANGLTAPAPAVAYVSFAEAPDAPRPGWFVRLGDTDQAVLLAPCPDRGSVIEVPTSRVTLIEWPPARSHDLVETIRSIAAPNLFAECP